MRRTKTAADVSATSFAQQLKATIAVPAVRFEHRGRGEAVSARYFFAFGTRRAEVTQLLRRLEAKYPERVAPHSAIANELRAMCPAGHEPAEVEHGIVNAIISLRGRGYIQPLAPGVCKRGKTDPEYRF